MSFFKEEKRTQYSPLMTREEQVRDDDDDAKDDGRHRTRQSNASPIQSKSRQRDDSREQNARARGDDGDTDYD
jgi:hypothetical protein